MKEQEINQDDDSIKGSTRSADRNLLLSWPRVSVDSSLYQCESCLHLFNHKRITIFTNKGKYIETYQYCPSCGRLDAGPVDEDDLKRSYNTTTEVYCPNCEEELILSQAGLYDLKKAGFCPAYQAIISTPFSVTYNVCSHCADNLPSAV